METSKPKPQLHQSHLGLLYRCGEKFSRVVVRGEREPATVAQLIGLATHAVVKDNLTHKVEHDGRLMETAQIQDLARDAFNRLWTDAPLMLTTDEKAQGLTAVKGGATDLSIALSVLHHTVLAPGIVPEPHGVEKPWVLECKGYPYDLAGTWDVKELEVRHVLDGPDMRVRRIRDTKTRKKAPSQSEVDASEQFSLYALAAKIIDGEASESVHMDALIKPTKTLPARVMTLASARTDEDFKVFTRRFERAILVMETGAFTPANRADWWCSPEFCGFAADGSCPFYHGRKTIAVGSPLIQPTKGESYGHANGNGRAKKAAISPGSPEWESAVNG